MRWLRCIPGILRMIAWIREHWPKEQPKPQPRIVLTTSFPSSIMDELEQGLDPTEMLVLDPTERLKLRLAILQLERLAGTSIALHSFHVRQSTSHNHNSPL